MPLKLTTAQAKINAERELLFKGVVYSYLTNAYSRPNMFLYNETTSLELTESRMFIHPVTNKRVIVTRTGDMYYLTH